MSRLFSSSTSTCGYMVTPSVITFCYVGCRRCRIPIYLSNFDWPLAVFRPSETKTRIYVHMYGRGKTPERKTIETILHMVSDYNNLSFPIFFDSTSSKYAAASRTNDASNASYSTLAQVITISSLPLLLSIAANSNG